MPALKNTRVCPRRNFSLSSLTMSMTAWAAALSFLAFATAAAPMMLKRPLNSGYVILLGKPARQMAIPARTPLHWYWCMIRPGSTTGLLVGVGHHTTDKVGVSLVEDTHEVVQLALEVGRHSLATLALLALLVLGSLQGLTRVVLEAFNGQGVASVLDQLNNGVVEGILVLLQPASQVVRHSGGVVNDSEMRIGVRAGVGLSELGPLAQQVGHQLLSEGGIGGLGEERLLLKDGQEGHGLLKHVNALLQIHAEVNIGQS